MSTAVQEELIVFRKRSRHQRSVAARRRIWTSPCERYRVVESCIHGLATVYYAERRIRLVWPFMGWKWGWEVLSKHRVGERAEEAWRKAAATEPEKADRDVVQGVPMVPRQDAETPRERVVA